MKKYKIIILTIMNALMLLFGAPSGLMASSHREAPLISNDPLADNCDLYAFRSPNDPNKVTLIATYVPMQYPHGGPNYYSFGQNIRYEIHIDNNVNTPGDDITYRFTFNQVNEDPSTFFNIRLGAQNLKTTYKMEKSTNGGLTWTTVVMNGTVPPPFIGERSIQGGAGLNTTYATLFNNAITNASSGEKVFCGTIEDPFFVDLGGVFDLGDMPRQGGTPKDGLRFLNVSAIALEIDIAALQKDGMPVSAATSILDPNYIIGVWASASRQQIRTLSANGIPNYTGPWVQVSRLGMPLTNEAVIPIGKKDLWNAITPYQDLAYLDSFKNFFYNPELALYMDSSLFGGAVPAFSPLRIQRNSLQAFDFGNEKNGLYGLKGSPAVAGTALDDALFGNLLLPAPSSPRSVDLWPIFHTGVPNLAPYQLATGKGGNPLANGKPFINNFLPNGGDMLRLNMAVPVTPRNSPDFSSNGLIQAAVLGLTNPLYNSNTSIQFIPNMDGFPNGRRLEDDVTRIELQAVAGVALAAIGLWYDDYTAGDPNPVTTDLLDVLTYSTGINQNDTTFRSTFPFVQMPWIGTGEAGGLAVPFTQAPCLANTASCLTAADATINGLMVNNVTGVSAVANWTAIYGIAWHEIRHKPVSSSTWITSTTGSAPTKTLINLMPNTMYEVQVRGFCSGSVVGPWSSSVQFMTNGTCGVPDNLFASNITTNKAKLNWNNTSSSFYTVRYKPMSASTWIMGTSTSNSKMITGLMPNTVYEFQVRSHCGSNMSAYSASGTFSTLGMPLKGLPDEDIVENEVRRIYPNPTTQDVQVEIGLKEIGILHLQVIDMNGRVVKEQQEQAYGGVFRTTLHMADLSKGVYSLRVSHNGVRLSVHRISKY